MTGPTSSSLALFQTLVEIVAKLRSPQGCPWDKEQTQASLTQYAIEEAYELVEAIESGNQDEVREELGDYLFQVVLQAQVAQDEGHFDLASVIAQLNEKMLRRHPHVFGDMKLANSEEVWKNWDKVKNQEKKLAAKAPTIFSYPQGLPALQAAGKIGRKTEGWKFDWSKAEEVLAKVQEELDETREALADYRKNYPNAGIAPQDPGREELVHEIGDLLFSTSQLARHLGLDAEACLRQANHRFMDRFQKVVTRSGLGKDEFAGLPDSQKEQLWREIKQEET